MNILINGLGIRDSGGIVALDKLLDECANDRGKNYIWILNKNANIVNLIHKYQHQKHFIFKLTRHKGALLRIFYENIILRKYVRENKVDLVHNFSGTNQIAIDVPCVVKVQNLMFFSSSLDAYYFASSNYLLWLRQIFIKRLLFKFMLNTSKHIEVQSAHVEQSIKKVIPSIKATFHIKSDVDIISTSFSLPKRYDFSKKVSFLYIVGPHFKHIHKNLKDFTDAMFELDRLGIDYEIVITLTKAQLHNFAGWDSKLDSKTKFLGYLSDKEKIIDLYTDNTILVSTSVIETLGLHVIDGIKKGVVVVTPKEPYADAVYGYNCLKYELGNAHDLVTQLRKVLDGHINCANHILTLQLDLKQSESNKCASMVDVFNEVLHV